MWVLTEERNANKKSKSLETRVTQRRQMRYGELDNISRQFDCGDDEDDDGVWGSTRRDRRRVLFFSPNISQWVWEEEKGVNTTHTHTHAGWMISSYHPVTSSSLSWQTQQIPPFAALYPVYSVSIACISYNENTFFGLVKATWIVFWRNLKENKVCASVMT